MKTVLKSILVGLVVFTLSFSPALMGMARAAGLNYEGFSSYRGYGDDMQTRGAMLNFSFGGPKDYKKNASLQDMYEASLTRKQKTAIGMGIVGFVIFLVITHDDDDECRTSQTMTSNPAFAFSELEAVKVSIDPCHPLISQ